MRVGGPGAVPRARMKDSRRRVSETRMGRVDVVAGRRRVNWWFVIGVCIFLEIVFWYYESIAGILVFSRDGSKDNPRPPQACLSFLDHTLRYPLTRSSQRISPAYDATQGFWVRL